MGLSASSRKLTIDNTDLDIVKVSNQVVERLKQEAGTKKDSKKGSPLDEATQFAVDLALEYWKNRIERIKANQEQINNRLQDQYDKTYKEYEDLIPKGSKAKVPPDMKKLQAALIKCYKANQKKSLNCAGEVENFNNWFEKQKEDRKQNLPAK